MMNAPSTPVTPTISTSPELSQEIERALDAALEPCFKKGTHESPKNLSDSIRYSLLAPGKRIRPRLAVACGDMIGVPRRASLAAGIAIEMIHCFSLIHDDLPSMDNDDFRRGRPSNHKVYGEAIALLSGDALMPIAFQTLADARQWVPADHVLRSLHRLTEAIGPLGMVGGQAAELLIGQKPTLESLYELHAGKTGALFQASLLMPKDLAGISDESPDGHSIHTFASELGIAFQVADDLDDAKQDLGHPTFDHFDGSMAPPTSVLHYLKPAEASERSIRRLTDAGAQLEKRWGSKSESLLKISGEVLKSLKI
jgi:geranylgeranyl diphosphate synthase type II